MVLMRDNSASSLFVFEVFKVFFAIPEEISLAGSFLAGWYRIVQIRKHDIWDFNH